MYICTMVNENPYTKKRQEQLQRDVENALVQGADVELRVKEGIIRDVDGRKMFKVTASEIGCFGLYVDVAHSLVHGQIAGLISVADYSGISIVISESLDDSRHWKIEVRMVTDHDLVH